MIMTREEVELQIMLYLEKIDSLKMELHHLENGTKSEKQELIDQLIELGFENGKDGNTFSLTAHEGEIRYEVLFYDTRVRWGIFDALIDKVIENRTFSHSRMLMDHIKNGGLIVHFIKKTYDAEHYFITDEDMHEDQADFGSCFKGTYEILKTYKLGE